MEPECLLHATIMSPENLPDGIRAAQIRAGLWASPNGDVHPKCSCQRTIPCCQDISLRKIPVLIKNKLEGGPMPNMMAALPNMGGALCSTPLSLADASTREPCSNAAKAQNPLKFAGVPQTRQQISTVSRPKFTILAGHVEVLLFNNFFRLSIHASVPKI